MVRLRDMPGFKAVMGYRYIDDIVLEQERQRQQLEQALSTATTNSEIVDSISKIYWLIYRMDLVSGIYEEVSAGQEMHRLTGKWGRTDQVFQEVRETIVAQEHQEQMRRFLDTSTLPQRLRDTESVAMEYHAASGSWHLARFIVKKRDKVMQASGFLLDLVNDVLDMNRLESGTVVLEHKPFDLTQLLEETCGIIQMQGQTHQLRFQAQPWGIQHPHLLGSPLHLRQVLQNIGGNAVKYNRDGGSITVRCEETGCADGRASFRFVCDDTGRGMSREFQKHAFEPFTQEEYGARTSYTGTGLGLSIAKQLVEKMGGDVRIQSQRDVGTRVEIDLSFDVDQSYEAAARQTEQEERIDLTGVRVLLVEDNDLNMECARFTLEQVGMEVTSAWNGQEAVDAFAQSDPGQFDLILMDVMMPVLDGLGATRAIRAMDLPDASAVPIFAMTANAFPEDMALGRHAGMNEHLSKPLRENELLKTIRRYVKSRSC